MSTSKSKSVKAKQFDQSFDKGEDVSDYLEMDSLKLRYPVQRVSIDFTKAMLEELDNEAAKIGVTRTSLIKIWIAERLASMHATISTY